MVWLVRTPPGYWQPTDPGDDHQRRQREQAGLALENRLPGLFTQPREDGEVWTLTLTQNEINAWIDTRSDKWLRNQRPWLAERGLPSRLPAGFKRVMVGITPKYLALAAEVEQDSRTRIVSAEFEPIKGPNDAAGVKLRGIKGGRLPLPRGILEMLIQRFGSEPRARAEAVTAAAGKLEQMDLILPVGHERRVHILDVALSDGAMTLTCQSFSGQSEE